MERFRDNSTRGVTKRATTGEQFELMVKEIEKRPELATGMHVFAGNRSKIDAAWEDITLKLNSIGPPVKMIHEWKKVWSDLKNRTKKKLEHHSSIRGYGVSDTAIAIDRLTQQAAAAAHTGIDPLLMPLISAEPLRTLGCENSNSSYELPESVGSPEETKVRLESDSEIETEPPLKTPSDSQPKPKLEPEPQSEPTLKRKSPPSPAGTSQDIPKRKRRDDYVDIAAAQLACQRKYLKVAEDRKYIEEQQLLVFTQLADAMTRQANSLERQALAVDGILRELRQRDS